MDNWSSLHDPLPPPKSSQGFALPPKRGGDGTYLNRDYANSEHLFQNFDCGRSDAKNVTGKMVSSKGITLAQNTGNGKPLPP